MLLKPPPSYELTTMNQLYQSHLCIIGISRIEAEHPRETFRDIQFSLKIFLSRALWSLTAKELFPRFEKLFFSYHLSWMMQLEN